MRKDIIKLTGSKYRCVKLDLECDFAKYNERFTIGFTYCEATSDKRVAKKYVGLVDDYGKVLYVEKNQFKQV